MLLMQNRPTPRYARGLAAGLDGIRLRECGHSPRKERRIMSPRGRVVDDTSVHLINAGRGSLSTNGRDTTLPVGTVMVLRRGVWHRFDPDPGEFLEEWWFSLEGSLPIELADAIAPGRAAFAVGNPGRLRARFAELVALAGPAQPVPGWRATTYALDLLADILVAASAPAADGDQVELAMTLLQSRCSDRTSPLPVFLREHAISADAFRRRFVARTGLPPHAFWLAAKLSQAQAMLTGTVLPVGEIGAAVGIANPFWFTQWFRRATGFSPSAWRAAHTDSATPPPAMVLPAPPIGPPSGTGSAGLYREW